METEKAYSIGDVKGDVAIIFKSGTQSLSMNTTVISGGPGYLDVKPLAAKNGKLLTEFSGVSAKLLTTQENSQLEFRIKSIQLMNANHVFFHRLRSEEHNKPVNKRNYKRFSLGVEGSVKFGGFTSPMPCIVKDVSYGGIGLLVKGKVVPSKAEFSIISFTFSDEIKDLPVNVRLVPVRASYDKAADETMVGLKVLKTDPVLQHLVNVIQRKELSKITHDRSVRKV